MRLDAHDVVAGIPALNARELLRKWGYSGANEAFVAEVVGVTLKEATIILRGMVAAGLLVEDTDARPGQEQWFVCTTKGSAFAQASAAKPLRRPTVEQKLTELVERMTHLNASPDFLVGIEEAYVYGSYLSNMDRLGDLDISLKFYRKEEDPEQFRVLADQAARESGRRFSNMIDWMFWPERKVLLFLKQRSRVFSLHVNEPLLEDPSVPRRAVFLGRRPA
jgi:hypothetical protein